jgi:hypothetical protein
VAGIRLFDGPAQGIILLSVLRCSARSAIMLRCCIICKVGASPDLQLQYCAVSHSALYCSQACQREDWRKHKKICKLLNVGHGDMQVRNPNHTSRSTKLKEHFERLEHSLDEDDKRFFKLFEESTFEGSRAAARKMKKIAKRQHKKHQKFLLFYSLSYLVRSSDSKMLSWPNSPFLVLLQFVNPNVLSGDEDGRLRKEGEKKVTLLHMLSELADPSEDSTHESQLILAKQLIEHGANVNAVLIPDNKTPLHNACCGGNVTNLDFVQLLLKEGADPNVQDHLGMTPLMYTTPFAPGAAKFLLNWPAMDVNVTTRSGESFLTIVRLTLAAYSEQSAPPDIPDQVQDQFLLQQWCAIQEMLVERGAHDTGITAFESDSTLRHPFNALIR